MGRFTGKSCRLSVMLALTALYFFVEIIFGYLSNSMALIADSFHMLSDVLALIIAFICMKMSQRKSAKNTFGWVRAEVLGALINAVFLLALCFSIFIEALKRIFVPEKLDDPVNILIVGAIGLVVNLIGILMFHGSSSVHGHSHARPVPLNLEEEAANAEEDANITTVRRIAHSISINAGEEEEEARRAENGLLSAPSEGATNGELSNRTPKPVKKSGADQLNMHGVFLHILGDAFGSVIVIVNAIIVWQVQLHQAPPQSTDPSSLAQGSNSSNLSISSNCTKERPASEDWWNYLDPTLSMIMVLIIVSTTIPLLKESALILLQTVPKHVNISEMKRKLHLIDGIIALHELHVWRLAGNKIIASCHLRVRNLDDYVRIAARVKQLFHDEGIHSTTIQPEFAEDEEERRQRRLSLTKAGCLFSCGPPDSECAPDTCCGEPLKKGAKKNGEPPTKKTPVSSPNLLGNGNEPPN